MSLETKSLEFGEFVLDLKEKELRRNGERLPVNPKTFQLLVALLEDPGHLVEKEQLMRTLWPDSFVEEANLAFTVSLLRKSLGDDAAKPRFIETVPRRGYRFIAPVVELENGSEHGYGAAYTASGNGSAVDLRREAVLAVHRLEVGIAGDDDLGRVDRLHRLAERRRHLQQVRHADDVGRAVVARCVEQRVVEEDAVAGAQRELDEMVGEVLLERGIPVGEEAEVVAVRERQQAGRAGLDRHLAVGDRTLQREVHRGAVHRDRDLFGLDEFDRYSINFGARFEF